MNWGKNLSFAANFIIFPAGKLWRKYQDEVKREGEG
jgi:hypothetical protein